MITIQAKALPNAEKIVKAAQLGYKTGEISYVEYLFCPADCHKYPAEISGIHPAGEPICSYY